MTVKQLMERLIHEHPDHEIRVDHPAKYISDADVVEIFYDRDGPDEYVVLLLG